MNASAPVQAAFWMIGAIVSFTAMAIAGRALAGHHDTFEIMTYRSLFGIVMLLVVAGWAGTLREVTFRRIPLHGLRNLSHFCGQNLWFYAVGSASVPLAQIFALEFTTPIIATFLAAIFLGERLTLVRLVAAAIGFAGVLIVAQPGADLDLSPGLVAAALAAFGFAGAAVCTRALVRTETTTCVLFYLTVLQAIFGLIATFYDGQAAWPNAVSLPWLILVSIGGLVAHFCITKALTLAPAGVVMPIDFARLPVIAVIGMLFFDEPLEWAVFAGALLILVGNLTNIRHEARYVRSR